MAPESQQDLSVLEFENYEDLPFELDHNAGFSASSVHKVRATKAYESKFGGQYALKKLPLELGEPGKSRADDRAKAECVREARALRYACHRHVVDIAMAYFFEGDDEAYFGIVMERANGNIESYLKFRRDKETRQRHIPGWFACLANAVAHIHRIGIRHRDIKPGNILLKGESVLLADFGISKLGLGRTLSTTVPESYRAHTPTYAAPEVGQGGTRGRAADIFSLGAVFLEMLVALHEKTKREELVKLLSGKAASSSSSTEVFAQRLDSVLAWMDGWQANADVDWHRSLLSLCHNMLSAEREDRPSAEHVSSVVSSLPPGGCRCEGGGTPTDIQRLVDACGRRDGLTDVQSLLLQDIKLKNTPGAIHQAAAHGFNDIMEAFFDHDVDVDLLDHSSQTALHCAAGSGREEAVDFLLEKGAKVNLQDEEGQTPLHCASGHGHLSIVKKLLYSNMHEKPRLVSEVNAYEQTALHLAAKRGHSDVVKALLKEMNLQSVTKTDKNTQTALHLAAGFGSEDVVRSLLDYSATSSLIDARDSKGCTALHFAARGKRNDASYLGVTRCLLDKKAKIDEKDFRGLTAKEYAESCGHQDRADLLSLASDRSKGEPGASLAPPLLAANIDSLEQQLSQSIIPRGQYSEEVIRQVSDRLREFHPGWERLTIVCMILYNSDLPVGRLPEFLENFARENITDYRLPTKNSDLSNVLQPGQCARFLQHQQAALVDDFRFGNPREHYNLRTDRWESILEGIGKIGQGQSGEVVQVKTKDTGDIYALKLIRRGGTDREKRAGEELSMLKRVKHANIVSLISSFTSPNFFGFLIEPMADCDLAAYLLAAGDDSDKRSALPGFLGCLVNALWYLHNVEYVRHNDIKPGNILVRDGRVFLTDFGVSLDWSKSLRSTTFDPSPAMTPMYCAPEVTQHDQPRDSFADIWSLGCVFLEIVTVLKGRRVDDIRHHLSQRDPQSMAYSKNTPRIRQWIGILQEVVGYINNKPLEWIRGMLAEYPKSRLTAGQLLEKLNSTQEFQTQYFGSCCKTVNPAADEAEASSSAEEDSEEEIPIEQHTNVAAVAWPGECRLYFQGTDGSIRQASRKQDGIIWSGGMMKDEIGRAKLCSPIAATAWEQKSGYAQPMVRVYFLDRDDFIKERTWDPASGWGDGALSGCDIKVAPFSQLAVTSWDEGNIMLCYQADNGTICTVTGWAQEGRWRRGATVQRAATNSPLTVFNFEHYGNRGIRLYFQSEDSVFREACWDHVQDDARADGSYFLGGYAIPVSGRASIAAIAWMDEELEMRVYVGTGRRLFERRYSGIWAPWEKSLEEVAEEAHISALRWAPGSTSVFSVERDGLVEILRADGSWTRARILAKSRCRGADCPSCQQTSQYSALVPPLLAASPEDPPREQSPPSMTEHQNLGFQQTEHMEHRSNFPSRMRRLFAFIICCF